MSTGERLTSGRERRAGVPGPDHECDDAGSCIRPAIPVVTDEGAQTASSDPKGDQDGFDRGHKPSRSWAPMRRRSSRRIGAHGANGGRLSGKLQPQLRVPPVRALSSGLRSEAPRSPVSTLVERLVASGRRSLRAPGQRQGKSSPGGLAGRRPSPPYFRRNGVARRRRHSHHHYSALRVFLPHDLGARVLEIRRCRRWWL